MKRSDAIKKLIPKVIAPYEVVHSDMQDIYYQRAERLLEFIEQELNMLPPETTKDKCKDPDYMFKYDRTNFDSGMDYCISEYFILGWEDE